MSMFITRNKNLWTKENPSDFRSICRLSSTGVLVWGSYGDPWIKHYSKGPSVIKCVQQDWTTTLLIRVGHTEVNLYRNSWTWVKQSLKWGSREKETTKTKDRTTTLFRSVTHVVYLSGHSRGSFSTWNPY